MDVKRGGGDQEGGVGRRMGAPTCTSKNNIRHPHCDPSLLPDYGAPEVQIQEGKQWGGGKKKDTCK